jgi:hypothetical protein
MLTIISRIRNWLFPKQPAPIVIEASVVSPPKRKHKKHVHLSKRKKAILVRRHRQGEKLSFLASEYNISQPTARRIVQKDREQRAYGLSTKRASKKAMNGHANEARS